MDTEHKIEKPLDPLRKAHEEEYFRKEDAEHLAKLKEKLHREEGQKEKKSNGLKEIKITPEKEKDSK